MGREVTGHGAMECRVRYVFKRAAETWWQKPLVEANGESMPAELAVLQLELEDNEKGLWINSRGTRTGVIRLRRQGNTFKTERADFPEPISRFLADAYEQKELAKGCPDLVIWDVGTACFRFVEVKCPLWDRPSRAQEAFMAHAEANGIRAEVIEWVFETSEV